MVQRRHDLTVRLHGMAWHVACQERGGFDAFILSVGRPDLSGGANSSQYHQMAHIDLTIVIIIHPWFSFPKKK